jgi:hypothetical protein
MLFCVVSCKKENTERHYGKYPILFSSSYETKATANVSDIQKNGFKVFAFYQANGNDLNFEKSVTYKSDQKIYDYEGIEYWIPRATYWFKAVYPNDLSYTIDNSTKDQKLTISNFDITSQHDILVATAGNLEVDPNRQAPTTGNVVELQFQHLLANVTIKAKSEIDGVTIQKIVIGHADTNSTYNGSVWSLSGNTTSIEYSQPTPLTKGAEFVDVTEGGILVIPASANNKTLTIQANKTYQLGFPNGTWEPGKRYTYTLEIKQDDIVFVDDAPYVEEWDSENATGSVIIK